MENMKHLLKKSERLEWFLYGGDGDEYELWQDPSTGKIYRVPIEIVRDWENITEDKTPKLLQQ